MDEGVATTVVDDSRLSDPAEMYAEGAAAIALSEARKRDYSIDNQNYKLLEELEDDKSYSSKEVTDLITKLCYQADLDAELIKVKRFGGKTLLYTKSKNVSPEKKMQPTTSKAATTPMEIQQVAPQEVLQSQIHHKYLMLLENGSILCLSKSFGRPKFLLNYKNLRTTPASAQKVLEDANFDIKFRTFILRLVANDPLLKSILSNYLIPEP